MCVHTYREKEKRERGRGGDRNFLLLVYSPDVYRSQGWVRLMPRGRGSPSTSRSSVWVVVLPIPEAVDAAGSWVMTGAVRTWARHSNMGCRHPKQWLHCCVKHPSLEIHLLSAGSLTKQSQESGSSRAPKLVLDIWIQLKWIVERQYQRSLNINWLLKLRKMITFVT